MRRGAVTMGLALVAALVVGLLNPAPASAADWRDRGWYGWLLVTYVGQESGCDADGACVNGHGTDREVRYRINGRKARVLSATGTSWTDIPTAGCDSSTTTWQYLGAGEPEPFGGGFFVDAVGASGYRLSAQPLMAKASETVVDCNGTTTTSIEMPVDAWVGCGPRPPDSGDPAPCQASDRERLTGAIQYVETYTFGSWTTTASWHLSADPDKDPCLTDPTCSGDELMVSTDDSGTGGDLGVVCGEAAFTWRAVTGRETPVRRGEAACVFLVGNQLSRQIVKTAVEYGVPIGSAFAGTLLREGIARYGGEVATMGAETLTRNRVMKAIAKAIGRAALRVNLIVSIGRVVGLFAVPLAGTFIYRQVKENDACIQVIVDKDGDTHRVDWSMVYAHSDERRLTMAKVYQKEAKRLQLDDYVPVPLRMRCAPDGTVTVEGRASAAFRSSISTWWRIN